LENKLVAVGKYKYSTQLEVPKIIERNYKSEPPIEFICPISQVIMENPYVADDGFSYEKFEIELWYTKKLISPRTMEPVTKKLIENKTLRILINDWKEQMIDQTQNQNQNVLTVRIKYSESDVKLIDTDYDETSNCFDLQYQLYKMANLNHEQYKIELPFSKSRDFFRAKLLVKDLKESSLDITVRENATTDILIRREQSIFASKKVTIHSYYRAKNIIYAYGSTYHKSQLWADIKGCGDSYFTGSKFGRNDIICSTSYNTFHMYEKTTFSKECHYMTRLDVVKKLFDAFINRTNAYAFNTAIGLISFSDKSEIECEITPYYESFREKVNKLKTDGSTAMFSALFDAADKLTSWKKADLEKRSGAKLRVVCLSDGKDTASSKSIYEVNRLFGKQNIILDVIVIGSDYDRAMIDFSWNTGGFMFNPSSVKFASDIMELETMIMSKNRKRTNRSAIIAETTLPPMEVPKEMLNKSITLKKAVTKFTSENTSKRLLKEMTDLLEKSHPCIDIYVNDNTAKFWKVVIAGPDSTPYQGGTWMMCIEFKNDYPFSPPSIRFHTPISHCNINNYGRVCHSILDRNYTPQTSVALILQCIYGLLLNPDVSDPLNTNLALAFYQADGQYEAEIMANVNLHARKNRPKFAKELGQ